MAETLEVKILEKVLVILLARYKVVRNEQARGVGGMLQNVTQVLGPTTISYVYDIMIPGIDESVEFEMGSIWQVCALCRRCRTWFYPCWLSSTTSQGRFKLDCLKPAGRQSCRMVFGVVFWREDVISTLD